MNNEKDTVTVAEAVKLLGVSRATINRLVTDGKLHGYRLTPSKNSPLRIYLDSIENVIRERQF